MDKRFWTMLRINLLVLSLLVTLLFVDSAQAETGAHYVPLTKGMVLNYGEPSLNRLKYIKVAVDVRVLSAAEAELVEYHRPALLDTLVHVFSASEEEIVKSGGGKEAIRQLALEEIQSVMRTEEGDAIIQELLFSTFVVQR